MERESEKFGVFTEFKRGQQAAWVLESKRGEHRFEYRAWHSIIQLVLETINSL